MTDALHKRRRKRRNISMETNRIAKEVSLYKKSPSSHMSKMKHKTDLSRYKKNVCQTSFAIIYHIIGGGAFTI